MKHDNPKKGGRSRGDDAAFDALLREAIATMPRAESSAAFAAGVMEQVRSTSAVGAPATARGGVAALREKMREACDRWVFCAAFSGALAGIIVTMLAVNMSLLGEYQLGIAGRGGGGAAGGSYASIAHAPGFADATAASADPLFLVANAADGATSAGSMQLFYADLGATGFTILPGNANPRAVGD
jgi:hypothetical protein